MRRGGPLVTGGGGRARPRLGPAGTLGTRSAATLTVRVASLWLALAADRTLGEPPETVHPVALFGRVMTRAESHIWADRRSPGVLYAAGGVALAGSVGALASAAARNRPLWRVTTVAAATYVAVAGRALGQVSSSVEGALARGDLDGARRELRSLVGRETSDLDEKEVVRATVESVAENTVDAVTAPLLWALAGGAPGVLAYRAVNTLDAMVGHRGPRYGRFGWAAARADDVANWVPARVTAAAVAVLRPRRAGVIGRAVRRQAPSHPSPNAGVAEAAFAAALDVQVGGLNDYSGRLESRPPLGYGPPPTIAHISESQRLSRQAALVLVAAATVAVLPWWRRAAG